MSEKKSVHIFGVTGSVGQSTAEVILSEPERFDVRTVTAHQNAEKLAELATALGAKKAVITQQDKYEALKSHLQSSHIECAAGENALLEAAQEKTDLAVHAIVGMAGLKPLWESLQYARSVAIANKEPLVSAGPMVMQKATQYSTKVLPLDSEHNAIFQVFEAQNKDRIKRVILTASGGPFRTTSPEVLKNVTPQEALQHPTWSMGPKITIDCATMINKALEIVEAHYLFEMPPEGIEVLIHPQSIVHSMVEYVDGSVLCQMGANDMKTPVANVLAWPGRMKTPGKTLSFQTLSGLTFEQPDVERFPALDLAYEALDKGGAACIVMNAANEIMVHAFLENRAGFSDIVKNVANAVRRYEYKAPQSIEDIIHIDKDVRRRTKQDILKINNKLAV